MDEFFIGYDWPPPPGLRRAVRRAALGLGTGALGVSALLAAGHLPVGGGSFEFGRVRPAAGVIVERPYPMLRPDEADAGWPLLVATGKHGAGALTAGLDGRRVALQATRIARGGQVMLEMAGEPTTAGHEVSSVEAYGDRDGVETLRGEIVDSKCFLGVMVPGDGVTHRDCASLCLRGGIPPALRVVGDDGSVSLVLIAGPQPAVGERAAAWAGERVEVTGQVTRQGGWRIVTADPAGWRKLAP